MLDATCPGVAWLLDEQGATQGDSGFAWRLTQVVYMHGILI